MSFNKKLRELNKNISFLYKTVLPATFEDEMSEYEVLAKLQFTVQELIRMLKELYDYIEQIDTPDKLKYPRKIELSEDVYGYEYFDGSKNINIKTKISDEFVNDLIDNILDIVNGLIDEKISNIDYSDLLNQVQNMIDNSIQTALDNFELPVAEFEGGRIGAVKIGEGISLKSDGTIFISNPVTEYDCSEIFNYGISSYGEGYQLTDVTYEGKNIIEGNNNHMIVCPTIDNTPVRQLSFKLSVQDLVLKELTLPSSVGAIMENAFYNNRIEKINFSEGLEQIGDKAFEYNRLRGELGLPTTVTTVGELAFSSENALGYGGLTGDLYLPNCSDVRFGAFKGQPLNKVEIGASPSYLYTNSLDCIRSIKVADYCTFGSHVFGMTTNHLKEIEVGSNATFEGEQSILFNKFINKYNIQGAGKYILIDNDWVKQ